MTASIAASRCLAPLRRAALFLLLAALAAFGVAAEPDIVTHEVRGAAFADVRTALEDAIAEEGLTAPTVSHFGAMLARTAPDLGHAPDLYAEAEIFSFCSVRAAAALAAEDARYIALCPLAIALFRRPGAHSPVTIAYRPIGLDTEGGRLASATQARIAARTLEILGVD